MIEVVSTRQFAQQERLDAWNELISETYDGMVVDAVVDRFDARLGIWQMEDLRIVRPRSRPATITRSQTRRRSPDTSYIVHILTEGSVTLQQRGYRSELKPGDMIICAAEESYCFDANTTHEMLVTEFDHKALVDRCPQLDSFVARPISGALPQTRILHRYLDLLWQEARGPMPSGHSAVQQSILLDLTVACLTGQHPSAAVSANPLLARIEEAICERLADPELGPAAIAADMGIPLRTVQAAAARAGTTIGRMISDLRLKKAVAILRRRPDAAISDVAFECGFADSSYFTRCFNKNFGTSPSRFRN